MIKITDALVKELENYGVKHVFMISGGGAMHINDSIGKSKQIAYICNHHEQASAIAAEGYARATGNMGVCQVTTGPGGLNTLTGVMGAWTDSVPILFISGQVKRETTIASCRDIGLRQLGDQEVDIISVVKPLTKYAVSVTDKSKIKYEVQKAIAIANSGRKGPVWIDIPMDIQGSFIEETALIGFNSTEIQEQFDSPTEATIKIVNEIKKSVRPLIIVGHGVRISQTINYVKNILKISNIPCVTTFNGFDLIEENDEHYVGRIGTLGSRAGNFALQNADLVICMGTRNNVRQISYAYKLFARSAKKIVIDVDKAELLKTTVKPDVPIHIDLASLLPVLQKNIENNQVKSSDEWLNWCKERKAKYPIVLPKYFENKKDIHPYVFMKKLTESMPENFVTIAGNGSACVILFQAGEVYKNRRYFWNSGCASMGYDIPAAIGSAVAGFNTVCLAGDGSAMMNIQELATIKHLNLPIKLFILNNDGYLSIKQTQESFFENRLVACDKNSGVGFPGFVDLAKGFGLNAVKISLQDGLTEQIQEILNSDGPIVCEVVINPEVKFEPKLSSLKKPDGTMVSKPLEDLYPFLSEDELKQNMIVNILTE